MDKIEIDVIAIASNMYLPIILCAYFYVYLVSRLWDHLALNIDLYVQPKELQGEAPKRRLISEVQVGGDGFGHLNSQSERGKSSKLTRSQHNKDWKGLVGREAEAPLLQSFVVDRTHLEGKTQSKAGHGLRSSSAPSSVLRKRSRAGEQQKTKVLTAINVAFWTCFYN